MKGLEVSLKKANGKSEKFEREMYLMTGKAEDAETKLSNHIPDAGKMTRLRILVESEIADFCAGLQSPGEPESAEEMQRQLMDRMAAVFDAEAPDDK